MRRVILDPKLIDKLAKRRGKSEKYIREMVSKLAHKHGVPSEVALVVLARKNGFGTAIYQRNLDSDKRAQVREILVSISATEKPRAERLTAKEAPRKRVILGRHSSLKLVAQNL